MAKHAKKGNFTPMVQMGQTKQSLELFGQKFVKKMQKHFHPDFKHGFLPIPEKNGHRLVFTLCGAYPQALNQLKEEGFECVEVPATKNNPPCIRVVSFPATFISPQAKVFFEKWRELVDIFSRINKAGDFSTIVSSDDPGGINELRRELEADNFVIRDKNSPRNGESKPGFVIIFSSHENEEGDEQISAANPLTPKRRERPRKDQGPKTTQLIPSTGTVPVVELLALAFRHMSEVEKLKILKGILPEGIGLYDINDPLRIEGGGVVVKRI